MCGIAGFVWRDRQRPAHRSGVQTMCDIIAHRGPDDAGVFTHGPVTLGHRRLSILDLTEAGHQPMISSDERYIIVFNGEVYNYVELAQELRQLGSQFRSNTDTEVILEAYRHWGYDCVSRFNGMWAFALYDTHTETMFLSRDRSGIKPLYYISTDEAWLFASEIKALAAVLPEARQPHLPYLARFLISGVFDDGAETCFHNVRQLMPAHNAVYEVRTNRFRAWRYWRIDSEQSWQTSDGDPVERLAELLESSIRLHMRSDVPVGTCLSGGIDSSAIVSLMSRLRPDPVLTFSGLYPDKACNEESYVKIVNAATGCQPCPVYPQPHGDLLEDLAHITWHQDEPTAGPGLYTQFHVMRRASREVKVILDGQGADELFAGYLHYFQGHLQDLMNQGAAGRLAALGLAMATSWHWGGATASNAWNLVTGGVTGGLGRRLAWLRGSRSPAPVSWLHPALTELASVNPIVRSEAQPFRTLLRNQLYSQVTTTSLPALLHYEDRNSMAHSIEARVPFLDYRIIEFAFRLDSSCKIHGSWTKWVLRKAAEGLLPRSVAWRRSKMGYPTPMGRWFREEPDRSAAADLLFSASLASRQMVSPTAIQRLWQEHQAGADHSWILYRVITTELWFRHFLDRLDPVPVVPPATPIHRTPALTSA
jgi:asparagine synthase (glutamine-hydrolysing)